MAVTFGGTTIPYGKVPKHPEDYAYKTWGYPGIDGVDFMEMGFRGRRIDVRGMSVAGTLSESTLTGFRDGSGHDLVQGGGTDENCYCLGWSKGRAWTDQNGYCFRFTLHLLQVEE